MKALVKPYQSFSVIFISLVLCLSCTKEEKPNLEDHLADTKAYFQGEFMINGIDVSESYIPFLVVWDDSLLGIGFSRFKLYEETYGKDRNFGIYDQPVNDTSYFGPREHGYHMGFSVRDFDHITCIWRNTYNGYFYAERIDSLRYEIESEGVLINQGCSDTQGEPDTVHVKLKGIIFR